MTPAAGSAPARNEMSVELPERVETPSITTLFGCGDLRRNRRRRRFTRGDRNVIAAEIGELVQVFHRSGAVTGAPRRRPLLIAHPTRNGYSLLGTERTDSPSETNANATAPPVKVTVPSVAVRFAVAGGAGGCGAQFAKAPTASAMMVMAKAAHRISPLGFSSSHVAGYCRLYNQIL